MQTAGVQTQEPSALPQKLSTGLADCPATQVTERSGNTTIDKAQLHAVGSIADISANWSAKVVVASNEQVRVPQRVMAHHVIPSKASE